MDRQSSCTVLLLTLWAPSGYAALFVCFCVRWFFFRIWVGRTLWRVAHTLFGFIESFGKPTTEPQTEKESKGLCCNGLIVTFKNRSQKGSDHFRYLFQIPSLFLSFPVEERSQVREKNQVSRGDGQISLLPFSLQVECFFRNNNKKKMLVWGRGPEKYIVSVKCRHKKKRKLFPSSVPERVQLRDRTGWKAQGEGRFTPEQEPGRPPGRVEPHAGHVKQALREINFPPDWIAPHKTFLKVCLNPAVFSPRKKYIYREETHSSPPPFLRGLCFSFLILLRLPQTSISPSKSKRRPCTGDFSIRHRA